jgi:hypothetical protein
MMILGIVSFCYSFCFLGRRFLVNVFYSIIEQVVERRKQLGVHGISQRIENREIRPGKLRKFVETQRRVAAQCEDWKPGGTSWSVLHVSNCFSTSTSYVCDNVNFFFKLLCIIWNMFDGC